MKLSSAINIVALSPIFVRANAQLRGGEKASSASSRDLLQSKADSSHDKRALSFWSAIGDWFTGCPAGNVDDTCSVGCPCSGSNTCEAWTLVCRAPGGVGDPCSLTRPCGSGLTCEAGAFVCRTPGSLGDTCHLTRPCGSGLTCDMGTRVCRGPGDVGDACHAMRPCGYGLRCSDPITSGSQMCLPECQSVSSATTARIKSHGYAQGALGTFGKKWDGGIVPYIVHCEMENYELSRLSLAMKEIREKTSIRFKRFSSSEDDNYVIFSDFDDERFWSRGVGRVSNPGWQSVNLDSEWIFTGLTTGIAIHEIMHVLGWQHTQTRADRDQYVTIKWENIKTDSNTQYQFKVKSSSVYNAVQKCRPYDYGSVMHYGKKAFSKNGKRTIATKDHTKQHLIGNRDSLSPQDIEEIEEYYFGTSRCL